MRDALFSLGLEFDPPSGVFLAPDKEGDMMFLVSTESAPQHKFTHDTLWTTERTVADLTFQMDTLIWRDPLVVVEVMARAARYVAERVGGVVRLESGEPYTDELGAAFVERRVRILAQFGLKPGDDATVVWLG